MKIRTLSFCLGVCLLVVCKLFAEPLPLESFSQLPLYTKPNLSPDGSKLGFVLNDPRSGLSILTVFNFTTGKNKYLLKSDNEQVRLNWFKWANNHTVIFSARFAGSRYGTDTMETRLLAMDVESDESEPRVLIKPRTGGIRDDHFSQFQDDVIDLLPDDENHILVSLDLDTPAQPSVYKVDVSKRGMTRIERGKRSIRDWITDQQSRVRVGVSLDYKSGESVIYFRKADDEELHTLFEYNRLTDKPIQALGFGLDPNVLYYKAYKDDKKALYKVDLTTLEHTLVFADEDYDVDGGLIYSRKTRDVIGLYHAHTETGRIYWDESYSNFEKALNKALPDTHNVIVDFDDSEQVYILYTENDYTPGTYYIGDRAQGALSPIFQQYPDITEEHISAHRKVSYKARDGVEIEGYLTLPKSGEKPYPTIIHPHGGPGARDYSGFDYWTAYFSDRGYAVFRPNFRGSSGYGYDFAKSQMKSWGLAMQDDITDGTQWLIEQGVADPNRMCIVGASYGGYAAAAAAVKTPDLFKCAVSFAGVSDLKALVRKSRHYLNEKFVKKQIGEDSDDLEARSPRYHAESVKIPILLVHGEDDRVVDVEQSRNFYDDLKDLDKVVTYVELPNGDHHLSNQKNRHRFFKEMDAFLQRYLGPGSQQQMGK